MLDNSSQYQNSINFYIQSYDQQYIIIKKQIQMNKKQTQTVIGIDLGSATAKVAAYQRSNVQVLTNQANFRQTPAVVGYGEGQRKIGQIGYVKLKSNYKNSIVSPTRYLGLSSDINAIKQQLLNCSCDYVVQEQNLYFKVDCNGVKENLTPQQVLAAFLTQIQQIVKHNNLEDKQIVFSVPSYFTIGEKKALLNAAQISGMKNFRLVSESVAIGLDYGNQKKSQIGEGEKNVVFIDYGHSKLSICLLKITQSKLEVILQRSNRNLGCRNIDQKLFEYVARRFQQKTGLNMNQNKKACLKLLQTIQRQRKILSGISESEISIQCFMQDQDLFEPFTRQTLYVEAGQVFTQISLLFDLFKSDLEKLDVKIDSIELVGGGSRIPKFIDTVEKSFGMLPSRTINSSQTIARGATIAAMQFSGLYQAHFFDIVQRSSNNICLYALNQNQPMQINNILEFNEVFPCQKMIKVRAPKNRQIKIAYNSIEQQIEKQICDINIEGSIEGIQQVALRFKVNENGFPKLESINHTDNQAIKFVIKHHKLLTIQQVSLYRAKEREMHMKDNGILQLYERKNQIESQLYKQKERLKDEELKKYITQQQMRKIEQLLSETADELSDPSSKLELKDFESKRSQIERQVKNLWELSKNRKAQIVFELKKFEDLKVDAQDAIKQIGQRFRNTRQVSQVCNQLKQIVQWAEECIKLTKSKKINELPAAPQSDIDQQYENIKTLINSLVNPQRVEPKTPRYYEPDDYYQSRSSRQPQDYQRPQYYQQQRRRPQQQFDPFGMSRSGFFGPSNSMFNFF